MSRIQHTCQQATKQGRKLLIPYLVAGDPDLDVTLRLMHTLVEQGADIIELGIPFSDPSSDGAVIQRGVERALARATSLKQVLATVLAFRKQDQTTPVVLMGYLNPIEIMGYQAFVDNAAEAGVDGVLVVDMPPAESPQLNSLLRKRGIDSIYLIAPTTKWQRAKSITDQTSGYLYYVSLKGVTGAALTDYDSVRLNIEKLRELTDLPIVIGFGIKDAASASAMAQLADGVVIGSALVSQIALLEGKAAPDAARLIETVAVIRQARSAIDSVKV